MLGGIIFQTSTCSQCSTVASVLNGRPVAITFYIILAAEFITRYLYKKPVRSSVGDTSAYQLDKNMKQMVVALAFSSLCVYVR